MTLCVVWRDDGIVNFASDSRLTLKEKSTESSAVYTDIAIKVLSLPYKIFNPTYENKTSVAYEGELGMCFAGNAINSLFIKETIVELIKDLQLTPGYTDISMQGIADYMFSIYKPITEKVCDAVMGGSGRAFIIIGGFCPDLGKVRVFSMETDVNNKHTLTELLKQNNDHFFTGSGKAIAIKNLTCQPTSKDILKTLQFVINDVDTESVGGKIQYGSFQDEKFSVSGIADIGDDVHYWRGALDINSDTVNSSNGGFVSRFTFIDPFDVFSSEN